MLRSHLPRAGRPGVTRADVLACVGAVGLLTLLLGLRPTSITTDTSSQGLYALSRSSQQATCQSNLRVLSMAMQQCMDEHMGYAPTIDDNSEGPINMFYTWVDLLYDLGYLSAWEYQICPTSPRPDEPTAERGELWGFSFVDEFGVGEPNKPGVRTSYGISTMISNSWAEDRFPDASRQIMLADGQWNWLGNINARWALQGYVGVDLPVTQQPNWQATAAWRHGPMHQANIAFMDGSVRPVTPRIPTTLSELENTVDTMEVFTWLPGEREARFDGGDDYQGLVTEWQGRRPAMYQWPFNALRPVDLNAGVRTSNKLWNCLPNDPAERH